MYNLLKVQDDPLAYPILQTFYDDLPEKPYTSHVKDFCRITSKLKASTQPYIQPNHHSIIKWLFIDIDSQLKHIANTPYYDGSLFLRYYDRHLPPPTIIMRNRENGHVQYAYKLTNPVTLFQNSHNDPIKYLKAIQYALTVQLGGDMSFGGSLAKNPLDNKTWDIYLTGAGSYTLSDLSEYLDLKDPANKPPKKSSNDEHISPFAGLGRNCDTFDYLRFIAYPIAHNMTQTALFNHLLALGKEFNSRFDQPMLFSEVRAIARSIAKFCKTSPKYIAYAKKFIEKQAEKGRKGGLLSDSSKGGKARSNAYNEQREQAKVLFNNGVSKSQIANQLGISRYTVITWLKE